MRKINYITILLVSMTIISCNKDSEERDVQAIIDSNDREKIQQLKENLYKEQRAISADLELVDQKLADFEDKNRYALVEAATVINDTFKHYIKIQGNVTTDENILVYPEFSGVLTDIYVEEGDIVKKGQRLAKIDDGGMQSQLSEMKAQQELAKTRFERQKRLWDENIGSEIQFLEAKTAFEQMNNSVRQLESQVGKSEILAPFDGVIDERITDEGQVVAQNQNAIFRIVNLREMYVQANVPETYVGQIQKGTNAILNLRALQTKLDTQVHRVSSHIEDSNRNFRVRVNLPDSIKNLKPNLIATVQLNDYTNDEAVIVAESVLQENASGEFFVYKLDQEQDEVAKSVYQKVKPGRSYQGKIEILEGIEAGDIIVTEGARSLKKGEKVRIANLESL
ncbi:MAG: efflux RND transporter periplasmic adaptor subunit [Bacteroidota bacterium]